VDGQDGAAQDHAGDDHAQPAEDDDIVLEVLALHIRDGVAGGQGHGGNPIKIYNKLFSLTLFNSKFLLDCLRLKLWKFDCFY